MKKMHQSMTPAEFIRATYIDTGHSTEKSLREAGLSSVLDGETEIDLAMAKRLSEVLGRSQESWIRMQQNHSAWCNGSD